MMDSSEIKQIFDTYHTIAVVGLSDKPERASYQVANYLKQQGYRIIPVNPMLQAMDEGKSYPDLLSIPENIDIVDIFRKPEDIPAIVDQAIQKKAKVIWMQEGIVNQEAAAKARAAGIKVVMDQCMLKEHKRIAGL